MVLLSIDPAITKPQAYAIFVDGKLSTFGTFFYMCELERLLKYENVDKVLFEEQYLSKNYKTSSMLTFNVGRMAGVCDLDSVDYETINVATWKASLGKLNIDKSVSGYKRAKIKNAFIIAKAKNIYDVEVNDDIASAIMMGHYFLNRE